MSATKTKTNANASYSYIVAFVAGLIFAVGLGLAGMTNPNKVLNFLDITGDWDPSLALVMGAAILVYMPVYRRVHKAAAPKFADQFVWPTSQDIDTRLVLGSILFGVGWGIAGFCPGPAIVATASGSLPVLAFFAAMLLGMLAWGQVNRWREAKPAAE